MHGLNEIISINRGAALRSEDDDRRSRGLKPASVTGQVLRGVRATAPVKRFVPAKTVITQGRERHLS